MDSVSTLRCLMVKAKSKLEKLNHRNSLLKRTLLRVSYNSWRIQWIQSCGEGRNRRSFSRKDRDSKNNQRSYDKVLYNPELLRVFDYLESLYDSDYHIDSNDSDYELSTQVSLPYVYRGSYHSVPSY